MANHRTNRVQLWWDRRFVWYNELKARASSRYVDANSFHTVRCLTFCRRLCIRFRASICYSAACYYASDQGWATCTSKCFTQSLNFLQVTMSSLRHSQELARRPLSRSQFFRRSTQTSSSARLWSLHQPVNLRNRFKRLLLQLATSWALSAMRVLVERVSVMIWRRSRMVLKSSLGLLAVSTTWSSDDSWRPILWKCSFLMRLMRCFL